MSSGVSAGGQATDGRAGNFRCAKCDALCIYEDCSATYPYCGAACKEAASKQAQVSCGITSTNDGAKDVAVGRSECGSGDEPDISDDEGF